MIRFYYLLIFLLFLSCKKDTSVKTNNNQAISNDKKVGQTIHPNFIKINSSQSNLHFNNSIIDNINTKENLFDFDFFYNGAGVGIEDINNDGLKDIFFCGNQVPNKLFINKGNLIFEDITDGANINTNKNWSNGVTFVDINNDGWMDIYISQGGPRNKTQRKNLLLINQKNLTFKEQATEYGLDDSGISTQSAFFDYDKDGDLDCVVMNENNYHGVDPINFYKILSDKQKLKENSSHLYENINSKYYDVTEKAGLLKPTFGLGLSISDINDDNWLDIYISNDYYVPDVLYINNMNGTFSNQIKEATNQVSFYGMGVDIADINNDNLKDIFVLDMASSDHVRSKTLMVSMNIPKFDLLVNKLDLHYQYMFNSLQLNIGNNKFHNIAQLAGISKTDWSWAGLIFDTNNDENEDIYVTNGYRKYALDNDTNIKIFNARKKYKGNVPLNVKKEIYNSLPSESLPNKLFKNNGNLNFEDVTFSSDLNEPSFSNGAAYSDLDNDGDLDIVVNNIDAEAFLFKNLTIENNLGNYLKIKTIGKTSENFAKVSITYNGKTRTKETKRVRGYLSAVDNTIHFGLGNNTTIDTLKVAWLSGKYQEFYNVKTNSTLNVDEKDAILNSKKKRIENNVLFKKVNNFLDFNHKENNYNDFHKEILLPYKQSTLGPFIAKGDINGDKKDDLYIGGASGQSGQLFIQTLTGFKKENNQLFIDDSKFEDMEALFFDYDNDGDNDLYVVSGGNEFVERSENLKDRIYINNGKGNYTRLNSTDINDYTISGKTVSKIDFDKDGDYDLIVGNRIKSQKYPLHEPSLIYENVKGTFKNITNKIAPEFGDFGIVNKVITTDFNNDGWMDFIAVGEWTHVGLFKNENGIFKDISKESALNNEKGWWHTIVETDVNNDGNKDYIIGNIGLNIKFKVNNEKSLYIYADDFDNNGSHDVVLSNKYNGVFVPVRGKECSTQQMPFISDKIRTYNEFANSSLEDIYGDKIYTAYQREANQFKSILLINDGTGKFKKINLPNMAQTIPIIDGDTYDFNKDGYEDIIVVGNIYNTEVETPRLDNPYALVLISNKKDGYHVLGPDKTNLYLNGNAKSIKLVKHEGLNKIFVIVGNNNAQTEIYELNPSSPKIF